ncbi:Ff.00g117580.m01.CDS01 [Fusarium sp. VM40]|nr:Ff.00g117580.m01.CDS01 [Fusarium sp. VM40]
MTEISTNGFKELPRGIASVVSHGQTYIFFVNSNHELCYLKSPQEDTDDFQYHVVKVTNGNLRVRCGGRQVAAMAWDSRGDHQIRIYCVSPEDGDCSKRGYIQEVAFNMANGWELGTLGTDDTKTWIDNDACLSACALIWPDKEDLKLFVSGKDKKTDRLKVTSYYYDYAENGWLEQGVVSNKVSKW